MADNKKSSNFLPDYLQTDKNKKFLSATLDEFLQQTEIERIDGYIGRKDAANYDPETDTYIAETSNQRKNYQVEPALVYKDELGNVKDLTFYQDVISQIEIEGGINSNIDKIFRSKYYSFAPPIDWDKLVNYDQYYWLPYGPEVIAISTNTDIFQNIIGKQSYLISQYGVKLSNGMKVSFDKNYSSGTTIISSGTEYIVEGVGTSIKLVDFSTLKADANLSTIVNESFDSQPFDKYEFDSDAAVPLTPEYVTINKASKDLNSWSRYNRWFHQSIITATAAINNIDIDLNNNQRAQRPIIEFQPDIQLWNFGNKGLPNIDLIDTTTVNPSQSVENNIGYYIDQIIVEDGYRIVFNNDSNVNNRKKVYVINLSTNTTFTNTMVINLVEDTGYSVEDMSCIGVNYGVEYGGKAFYYSESEEKWIEAQHHSALNQAPLFDIFDEQGQSVKGLLEKNDFNGSKIFGYSVGNGVKDTVLGFPLNYNQSLVGIGSIQFTNYFSKDIIKYVENVASTSTNVDYYFYKSNSTSSYTLNNVFAESRTKNLGIVDHQVINQSTNSIFVESIALPIGSISNLIAKVNNKTVDYGAVIEPTGISVSFFNTLSQNDFVSINVETTQTAAKNGFYEPSLSLNNNPFNERIINLSFTQLVDHVNTMITNFGPFDGQFPGESNLRDLGNISKYGNQIVANEELITFVELFLNNKENNVIESLRWCSEQYNMFKQNFLKAINFYTYNIDPVKAVDSILADIFKNKLYNESFYTSDMVPYGDLNTYRKYVIKTTVETIFPLVNPFDLTRLSYQGVLVYRNGEQLLNGIDYVFNYDSAIVEIISGVSVDDVIELKMYESTKGCFVPPTPTKYGLYFKYIPQKFIDTRYADGSVEMLRGHDGSLMKAYGDYRDDIILELEKRIYNNIKIEYDKDIFNIWSKIPGLFRSTKFTKAQFEKILEKDFANWASKNGLDPSKNTTYEFGNIKTYNYIGLRDKQFLQEINGTYRSVYRYIYDTDRPDTHPWECLGFVEKPDWWESTYGTDYNMFNNLMWVDVLNGNIRYPSGIVNDPVFNRPSVIQPTDPQGDLRDPIVLTYDESGDLRRNTNWEFGDFGPVEVAWRNSSYYPFSLQVALILQNPVEYLSKLFDISRIKKNVIGQYVWAPDNSFLSPRKLLIEGYSADQAAGFGNFFFEYGTYLNKNYKQQFDKDLKFLDMNLSYKVGGFTTKDKIQVKINAVDPESTSPGLTLPAEDYDLKLNVSNAAANVDISGVIIQKTSEGYYAVRGYNRNNLSFKIYKPLYSKNENKITIGGKPESFVNWQPNLGDQKTGFNPGDLTTAQSYGTKFYKQGQIVSYQNKFYRVTVSHAATKEFQLRFFQQLTALPRTGGVTVLTSSRFSNTETTVPYGYVFEKVQDVYDFIIGYGNYLEKQGFLFDLYNQDLNEVIDWNFSAKEFLYWSIQNWAPNNLITLSPFSEYVKFFRPNFVVDNILSDNYYYALQNADGTRFPKENIDVTREDNTFILRVINSEEGIYFASLNLIQKEHVLIFNNTTIFNDTVFDRPSGYRQQRFKISGFRTKGWNGDLSSPGFMFYKGNYSNWEPFRQYNIGDIVFFNGKYYQSNKNILGTPTFDFTQWNLLNEKYEDSLLPNFDYKINQFEDFYSLDIDNFDTGQQKLSQHLTGYTERSYLSKLINDPIAQYKFYQGFIKEKGTINPLSKIVKAVSNRDNNSIDILEEWAVRVGAYGSYSSLEEIEFIVEEGSSFENPYLIKFSNTEKNNAKNLIHYTSSTDLLVSPDSLNIDNVFYTTTGTYDNNSIKLTSAGYVRLEDVTATAYNKNSLLDIANNNLIQNGDTIWIGFLENGNWTVKRYFKQPSRITGVFVSSPASSITFVTDRHHNLVIGDVVSVVGFNKQVDGVYIVLDIPNLSYFTVASTLSGIVNEPLLSYGSLFKFESARFNNYDDWALMNNQLNLPQGSKTWIDKDENNKWAVFEKIKNFNTGTKFSTFSTPVNQGFGKKIWANENSNVVLVSSPSFRQSGSLNVGKVTYYRKDAKENLNALFDFELNYKNTYVASTTTDFGYELAYDMGKELMIVGAPSSDNVRATTETSTASLIAVCSGSYIISRGWINEGVVKISSKNAKSNGETTKVVIAQPYSTTNNQNSRFGHSIYINNVDLNTSTTMLIGAPGNNSYLNSGTVYAYKINLLNVDQLNFNIDTFVNNYRGSYSFIDYKNKTLTILPYYQSNNLYVIDGINRYGLFRDPDNDGLAYWVNLSFETGVDGQTELANTTFFYVVDQNTTNFDYARSFTANKLYQKQGTIDLNTFFTNSLVVQSSSTVVLNNGSKWGYAISGSSTGDYVAISAPRYFSDGTRGIVQVYDKNLQWRQAITSPFGENDEFGISLKVSKSGKFLLVGSNKSTSELETYGRVAVYILNDLGLYSLNQIIDNPIKNSDLIFAHKVDINDDEQLLSISSLGTNKSEYVKFYQSSVAKKGETTFDNNQTKFVTVVPNSGSVYLYQNFDNKFIEADEILPDDIEVGGSYGFSLALTNDMLYVGAPAGSVSNLTSDISSFYQFKKLDKTKAVWDKLRYQEDLVDIEKFSKITLIDNEYEEVIEFLDIYDPIKGRIPGIAEQEITFKSTADPAIYSVGRAGTNNDSSSNWLDEHIGHLWWDLSTAKFIWYEQGNEVYRKNNWGKLFPGATIDIYEWVRSTLSPSEWAVQADTAGGLARGISGQPKYPDNSVVSVKQVLNTITGSFENVYFFWVKNKVTVPANTNRKLSALQVSRYISDPLGNGLRFIEFLSKNSLALANVQGLLKSNYVSLNIAYSEIKNLIPKHTEWDLMREGDITSQPSELLEKKLLDSLVGLDVLGNSVPDQTLTFRNRYGLGIRPQQTIFKNRFEAIRNVLGYANYVLAQQILVGNNSFRNLDAKEDYPAETEGLYDFVIDDRDGFVLIETINFKQAVLSCNVKNGKITGVSIIDPGFGYQFAPKITISPNPDNAAILTAYINGNGQIVTVEVTNEGSDFVKAPSLEVRAHSVLILADIESNNRWSLNYFDYVDKLWIKNRTQLYNTTLYWDYIDYKSNQYNEYKIPAYIFEDLYEINSIEYIQPLEYVKVNNIGNGTGAVLERVMADQVGNFSKDYNIVYQEKATIKFSDTLWNIGNNNYGFDKSALDETLYDQLPDLELRHILNALRNDLFIEDNKVYWNLLFFKAVKYAHTEQKFLDWAFKTSFVVVKNRTNYLDQPSAYRVNNSVYYEDFLKEVKPYKTKIRNFVDVNSYIESADLKNSDFDVPAVYNETFDKFLPPQVQVGTGFTYPVPEIVNTEPYKTWYDNKYYYVKEVIVVDGGSGFTSPPAISFIGGGLDISSPDHAKGKAYIRNGSVYKIEVTYGGKGYQSAPNISFAFGYAKEPRYSVILANDTTRKNYIGIKFDRYSKESEIGNIEVTYTPDSVCDGANFKFELPFRADQDKQLIFPTLDKKLVLAADYTIEEFVKTVNGFDEIHSRFVFINYIPAAGKIFKVIYRKHSSLFNAIDRINEFYQPSSTMVGNYLPMLMKGLEYPNTKIQGLEFNYSTPLLPSVIPNLPANWYSLNAADKVAWYNANRITPAMIRNYYTTGTVEQDLLEAVANGYMYVDEVLNGNKSGYVYDYGGWNDTVDYYSKTKIVQTATYTTTTIYLSDVSKIKIGQSLNFLNTSVQCVRTGTVVTSVNTLNNTVAISSPVFKLVRVFATDTSVGSFIKFETKNRFLGDVLDPNRFSNDSLSEIRVGDRILVSGILTSGYDGIHTVYEIDSDKTFVTTAPAVLAATEAVLSTTTSQVRVLSLLQDVAANNKVIGNYNFYVGPCLFPEFSITARSPATMEGYSATFTIDAGDLSQVSYGLGRTFGFYLSGVSAGDVDLSAFSIAGAVSATVTAAALSLPITFQVPIVNDATIENTETLYINLFSYVTTSGGTTATLASTSIKLRDRPTGPASYSISAFKNNEPVLGPVLEGDTVEFKVIGTNVDFGSDGRAFRIVGTGTNITNSDVTSGSLTSTEQIIYSEDEFPISFTYTFEQDAEFEPTEIFYANLESWLNYIETPLSATATTSVSIINNAAATYALSSNSPVFEGSTVAITLITTNVAVGSTIPYTLTTLTNQTIAALQTDLNTSTNLGSFVMASGPSGSQISTVTYAVATGGGYEGIERFRLSLNGKAPVINKTYIDININDAIVNNYGQEPSSVVSYVNNGSTAFSRINIKSAGTFTFEIATIDSIYPSNINLTPNLQTWAVNSTGLSSYYVRAIVEPAALWEGNAQFTGPGFGSAIDKTYFETNGYTAVPGSWVTISTADATPWEATGTYSGSRALAAFYLTVQIAETSGGTPITSGRFGVTVDSSLSSSPPSSTSPSFGTAGGDVGSGCPDPLTEIMTSPTTYKLAGDLELGDIIWTIHETTMDYGYYAITSIEQVIQPKVLIALDDGSEITVSQSHKFYQGNNQWKQVFDMSVGDKIQGVNGDKQITNITEMPQGSVVKLEVDQAHTYIANGLISHNIKATEEL